MKFKGRYLLILIAMCGLLGTSVGLSTNVAGIFFSPVAEDFGILKGSVSMTLTICNLVFAFSGLLAAKIINEKTFRPILIICTALIAGSTALMAAASNIYMLYILSAVRGFGGGILGFVLVTTVINYWFIEYNGLITSIAMGASGLVGALFSPIVSGIVTSSGWRTGYLAVAVLMALFNLPSILFVPCMKPETKGFSPLGTHKVEIQPGYVTGSGRRIDGQLLVMAIVYALIGAGATALPQHFPGLSEAYGLNASVGATMLSVCMIANTSGKIVLGALIDRFGTRRSLLLYLSLVFAAATVFLLVHQSAALIAAAAFFGLSYALGTVGNAMISKDFFGLENYGKTYPKISLASSVANALFSSLIGYMYDFTGGYSLTLLMYMVMLGGGILLVICAYRRRSSLA